MWFNVINPLQNPHSTEKPQLMHMLVDWVSERRRVNHARQILRTGWLADQNTLAGWRRVNRRADPASVVDSVSVARRVSLNTAVSPNLTL